MKEYAFRLSRLAKSLEAAAMFNSGQLGFKSSRANFGRAEWKELAEVVLRAFYHLDKGPWIAVEDSRGEVAIESDDFKAGDTRLLLRGDFLDLETKMLHAASIARSLNSPFVDHQWYGRKWSEVIDAPMRTRLLLTCVDEEHAVTTGALPPVSVGILRKRFPQDWLIEGDPDWTPTHWMFPPEPPLRKQ